MEFTLHMVLGKFYSGISVVNPTTLADSVRVQKDKNGDCMISRENLVDTEMTVFTLHIKMGVDPNIYKLQDYSASWIKVDEKKSESI